MDLAFFSRICNSPLWYLSSEKSFLMNSYSSNKNSSPQILSRALREKSNDHSRFHALIMCPVETNEVVFVRWHSAQNLTFLFERTSSVSRNGSCQSHSDSIVNCILSLKRFSSSRCWWLYLCLCGISLVYCPHICTTQMFSVISACSASSAATPCI